MSNLYLRFALVAVPIVALLIIATYARFRRGIATRMFSMLLSVVLSTSALAFYAGVEQSTTAAIIAVVACVAIVVPVLSFQHWFVLVKLGGAIERIVSSSAQISSAARQGASTASEQAGIAGQINTAVGDLRRSSEVAAATADEVRQAASTAVEAGRRGLDAVSETRELLELIGQMGEIVDSVSDLADQSNILAVNASIEAAKAGEHGRGFAVVAAEVRSLAEQSKAAMQRIRQVIDRSRDGWRKVEAVAEMLEEIARVLDDNADRAQRISATAAEQAAAVKQIAAAMSTVAGAGEDSAAAARQLEHEASNLNAVGDRLAHFLNG